MNAQNTIDQVKAKANGKLSHEAMATGKEFLESAQNIVSDLIEHAPEFAKTAKTYSDKAIKWAKANPVPTAAIGGAALLLLFAPRFIGKKV